MRSCSAKWAKNSSSNKNQTGTASNTATSYKSPIATRKAIEKSLDDSALASEKRDNILMSDGQKTSVNKEAEATQEKKHSTLAKDYQAEFKLRV